MTHYKDEFFVLHLYYSQCSQWEKNASTCICEIPLAVRSNIASFQNLLLANNEEIGAL